MSVISRIMGEIQMNSVLKDVKPYDKVYTETNSSENEKFNIFLINAGSQTVKVIKCINEIAGISTEASMNIIENVPIALKEDITKTEASILKEKLENVGATVEIHKL